MFFVCERDNTCFKFILLLEKFNTFYESISVDKWTTYTLLQVYFVETDNII